MTDLIETVARAIADRHDNYEWDMRPGNHGPHNNEPMPKEAFIDEARAAIHAIEAAGYRIVPVEPTEEMLKNGDLCLMGCRDDYGESCYGGRHVWAELLAAAPKVVP